jgi:hypothetical protein
MSLLCTVTRCITLHEQQSMMQMQPDALLECLEWMKQGVTVAESKSDAGAAGHSCRE